VSWVGGRLQRTPRAVPGRGSAPCARVQRLCTFGLAYVDTPLGDLNHDGVISNAASSVQWSNAAVNEQWPSLDSSPQNDEAHGYIECSGRGTCDRSQGECKCYDGYTGSACQRTECPHTCSGHGVCRSLAEIAASGLNKRSTGSDSGQIRYSGVEDTFVYSLWDADAYHACICDPGYTGYDCSMRECPRGDDPLTTGTRYTGNEAAEWATMTFELTPGSPSVSTIRFDFTGWDGRTMSAYASIDSQNDAPGQRDTTTDPVSLPGLSTIAGKMMQAIRGMPGGLLQKAEVYADSSCSPGAACSFTIELVDRPGKQSIMDVSVVVGGATVSTAPAWATTGGRDMDGNREEITCSARGLCDFDSGICQCFQGYYGAACEFQNALAAGSSHSGSSNPGSAVTVLGISI